MATATVEVRSTKELIVDVMGELRHALATDNWAEIRSAARTILQLVDDPDAASQRRWQFGVSNGNVSIKVISVGSTLGIAEMAAKLHVEDKVGWDADACQFRLLETAES